MARKVLVGFAIVALLVAFVALLGQKAPPPPVFPSPNGYADFVKAGEMRSPGDAPNSRTATLDELRTSVENNRDALQLVRTGLTKQSRVTTEYSPAYMTTHMPELATFKGLARALVAEGKLAELENRRGDAARLYLDTIRFAHESVRGGLQIDALVGLACEAIGITQLEPLSTTLDAKQCRELLPTLGMIDANRETFADVMKQEKTWSRRAFGWRERMQFLVLRILARRDLLAPGRQKLEAKFQAADTRRRRLLIDLASRAYELEKGKRPATIAELAPDYLKAIPPDPTTGAPMKNLP
ncbi:MAG: hypothetical protein ABI651_14925 [Verrucomicrobiota bacterium]